MNSPTDPAPGQCSRASRKPIGQPRKFNDLQARTHRRATDPKLARLVAAWPNLSEERKRIISSIVGTV